MSDPRVARTRIHIRETVRELIAEDGEITISSVAVAAKVSRRTIYSHWGTIEDLAADSIFDEHEHVERAEFLATYKNPLRMLPAMVREVVGLRTARNHSDAM